MDKSLEDLPLPKIKQTLIIKNKTKQSKKEEQKFTYLDKILQKSFLDEYFKKKSK
tara:strand:- start:294 stop:458 length:165 start_codon:yes stop_codon:yes gene_type:complete